MALAKALQFGLAGLVGGLEGVAESAVAQDKREQDLTDDAVKITIAKLDKAKEEAKKDYKAHREREKEIDSLHGTLIGKDKATGELRPLSRSEIGQMIGSIGKENLVKYAFEEQRLIVGGKAKKVDMPPTTELGSSGILSATEKAIPTGEGIAAGQGKRVTDAVSKELERLGYSTDPIEVPTEPKYIGGVYAITEDKTDAKVNASFVTSGTFEGKDYENVSVVQMNDGTLWVNDPRIVKAGQLKLLPKEFMSGMKQRTTRTEEITFGGEDRALGNEIAESYVDTMTFKNLQKRAIETQQGRVSMKQTYEGLWEEAQDPAIYGVTTTVLGSIVNRVKVELDAIGVVIDPEADKEVNRQSQLSVAEAFVQKNYKVADAAVKAKVLESKIFVAAVRQAQADGEERPTDADISRRMEMFAASSPRTFWLKANANVQRAQEDYEAARNAYLGPQNPLYQEVQELKKSGETGAAQYIERIYFAEPESEDGYVPTFLINTKAEDFEDTEVAQQSEEGERRISSAKKVAGQDVTLVITGTGPNAKVEFETADGTKLKTTTTYQQAIANGFISDK
jgi:hypothetical protein